MNANVPMAVIRKPVRTCAGVRPLCFIAEVSLIDRTGRTQGIAFRITPPRKATASIEARMPRLRDGTSAR